MDKNKITKIQNKFNKIFQNNRDSVQLSEVTKDLICFDIRGNELTREDRILIFQFMREAKLKLDDWNIEKHTWGLFLNFDL